MDQSNKYTKMQKEYYDKFAATWSPENRDPVVGSFDKHNEWPLYENLFTGLDTSKMIGLDFGCGPGRNIVKFHGRFQRLDGVDISAINLEKARTWIGLHGGFDAQLFHNNGVDLSVIADNSYDLIMSTICLQHICVHDIRFSYYKEFFRILKSGGIMTVQQGFGTCPQSVDYYANNYDAESTNWFCDNRIESPDQPKSDLEKIGFTDFSHVVVEKGPGDWHANWIFYRAKKP